MIEVFITNIQPGFQAEKLVGLITDGFPGLKAEIDLERSDLSFPCGHSVLRIEGDFFQPESIKAKMEAAGFQCQVLEDKICNQS